MPKDIQLLYAYLKQRGVQTNAETFDNQQLARASDLSEIAKSIVLVLFNKYEQIHDTDNYFTYRNTPRYDYLVKIIEDAEKDGKSFWETSDFAEMWQNVLQKAWQETTERVWKTLSSFDKIYLLHFLVVDWISHEISILELIDFSNVNFRFGKFHILKYFLISEIDADNTEITQKTRAILQNQAEAGDISNTIIEAALRCNKSELWDDIAKLLLAAQRQEGLRQAIINNMHIANSGAKILLLQTIFDNNLQRFASVLGRLQWWLNLPLADGVETTEKNIERLGSLAIQFLQDKNIDNQVVIQNKNATETHFQLWALRETNALEFWKTCDLMMQSDDAQKRAIAMYSMRSIPTKGFDFAKKYCKNETDLAVRWNMFKLMEARPGDEKYDVNDGTWEFFEKLIAEIPTEKWSNPKPQFAWEDYKFEAKWLFIHWAYRVARATRRSHELLKYKERFDADLRSGIFSDHFREQIDFVFHNKPTEKFNPNDFDRAWVIENMQDKSANVARYAFKLYELLTPKNDELPILFTLLTRKNEETRKSILDILQKLPDADLCSSVEILLVAKKEEQQLAGLDLLQQLKKQNRLTDFVLENAKKYSEKKTAIGSKAELILHDILDDTNDIFDEKNGYGLYNPNNRGAIPVLKKPTTGFFVEKMLGQPMFGLSVSMEKLEEEFRKLDAIFVANENHEYEVTNYEGNKEKVLVSNAYFQRTKSFAYNPTYAETMTALPLADLFDAWFKNSGLNFLDLYIISEYSTNYTFTNDNIIPDWLRDLVKNYTQSYTAPIYSENRLGLKYPNHCKTLIGCLYDTSSITGLVLSIEMDITQHYFASIPPENRYETMRLYSYMQESSATWMDAYKAYYANFDQAQMAPDDWGATKAEKLSDVNFIQFWNIIYWYYCVLPTNRIGFNCCKEGTLGRAYTMGLVNYDEFCHLTLATEIWNNVTNNPRLDAQNTIKRYPIYQEFLAKAKPHFLNIELKRGETPTAVSKFVVNLSDVVGVAYFSKIAKGLGKDTLQRGYSYTSYLGEDKTMQFSRMLKACTPAATETYEDFKTILDELKLSEKRLVQFALYSPQWLPWTAKYLGWQGLENAAWCLHAHSQNYFDVQKQSEIIKYSNISEQDFQDGAVDIAWFKAAYAEIGEKRWTVVYDAAHYICETQGYVRAKVYAAAILGQLALDDCKKRILDKRNKDYVVSLGLIPLSPSPLGKVGMGILDRYRFIQAFKKSGKDVGAQRQESEKRVCVLALENLARNAGYADPIRLTWAMETLDLQELMKKVSVVNIENTSVALSVNALGKAEVIATKNGKALANIPPTIKKNEDVTELIDIKSNLNAQHSRIKTALEEAMIRGDVFDAKEMENLMLHPIIKPLMNSLVWSSGFNPNKNSFNEKTDFKIGFLKDIHNINEFETYRIAHCADLHASAKWSDFQKAAFQTQLVQPFKQIFRELYLPTKDELAAVDASSRYAGYEVATKQAAALFKARGWVADYNYGVQKVFLKERIIANVQAYADWYNPYNSAMNTEINGVRFTQKNTHQAIAIKDVPTAIFSEIMRDLDLVVSVAHVGGVDIEASLSSMELRGVIVEETAALFGLTNVEIEKSHIFIKGTKGDYTIHLGSGIAHKVPSVMLHITPISTQARGRIFLPFVDEDPKTAEIVSKMLLLAKDEEIQDPSILAQI